MRQILQTIRKSGKENITVLMNTPLKWNEITKALAFTVTAGIGGGAIVQLAPTSRVEVVQEAAIQSAADSAASSITGAIGGVITAPLR